MQYIADRIPESGLAPRPYTLERYQLQEWLGFISSELHKAFVPLFKPDTPAEYKQLSQGKPRRSAGLRRGSSGGQELFAG